MNLFIGNLEIDPISSQGSQQFYFCFASAVGQFDSSRQTNGLFWALRVIGSPCLGHPPLAHGSLPPHPQEAGGVLQRLHVVDFQKVCTAEGAVDGGVGVGLVVRQDHIGRIVLQDRQSRRRTQVAAQAPLLHHQFQPLHAPFTDLDHRPVPLRPIRPHQVVVHAPLLHRSVRTRST